MREMEWPAARPRQGLLIDRPGFSVSALPPCHQTLVSGNLEAALAALASNAPLLGLGSLADSLPYVIRIARDRALIVSDRAHELSAGWHNAGYAATALGDAYVILALAGEHAPFVVAQAVSADLDAASPSAAVLFAGETCLLIRSTQGVKLHVPAPMCDYIIAWLEGALLKG